MEGMSAFSTVQLGSLRSRRTASTASTHSETPAPRDGAALLRGKSDMSWLFAATKGRADDGSAKGVAAGMALSKGPSFFWPRA
eukprot:4513365-Prymnesium_polylepis.1